MTEIAKCPYCGHDPMRYNTGDAVKFQIICLNCDMCGPLKNTLEAAIDAWNQVARMREALEAIRDYEPTEICKDDFAYDHMVKSYKDAAKQALKGDD